MTELVLLPRVAYRGREVTGARLRSLLALLAAELRRGSGTARLVDELWPGDDQPENPTKALQVLVARARSQLGGELIARTPTGYRLDLGEEQVDAAALPRRAAEAAAARDPAAALAAAEAGLALWDGSGADPAGDPPARLRAERLPAYRSLRRTRALALSRLGRAAEAMPALAALGAARDEEVLAELLRSEAATAGAPAALDRYEAYRERLRDELGADPGPALQAVFGELLVASAPAVRHGVAEEPNELLGRAGDLAAVAALLRTARVVSVTGPGGLGKTRLAHAVARGAEQRVVHLVALAAVTRDADVVGEVAAQLGLAEPRRRAADLVPGIVDALGPGPALLVLDNCEQVVDGVAALVRELVARTADLRVLTTTRAPLGLSSESVYLLPQLDERTAAALFAARARAARPDVDLPADAVAAVVRHLDGLPLAVELAAARVRVMSVAEISHALRDRFALLRGGPRDAPERHRTLLAVVDWSWNLLAEPGRAAMRLLSVFPAGFAADAAGAVLGGDPIEVLEHLGHLADQSLLTVTDTPAGTRFAMLEAVRELGAARLAAAGGTEEAVGRFLGWARAFAVEHALLPFGPRPAAPVERMRAERDNLVQALRHAVGRGDARTATAVTAALASLWNVESDYVRMRTLRGEPEWLLSHYRPEPDMVETTRLAAGLNAAYDFVVDRPKATRSLAVLRRLPPAPPDTLPRALAVLLTSPAGELDGLVDSDFPLLAGLATAVRSYVRESAGDVDGAAADAERVLASFATPGLPLLEVIAHTRVAELHMHADRGAEALTHLRIAMSAPGLPRDFPDVLGVRQAAVLACLQAGELEQAQEWLDGAGPVDDTFGGRSFELVVRAELLQARGEVDAGLGLWRSALELMYGGEMRGFLQEPGLEPWALEILAAAVVAHARAGRLDPVAGSVAEIERALPRLLADDGHSPVLYAGMPLCGVLLLALGMTDLARGDARSGVRLVALAERFSYIRQFAGNLSAGRARADAERADGPAYAEALSAYAGLSGTQLRDAAHELLAQRTRPNSHRAQR